ncbi:hypothetical protein I4F81_001108 [Pyropia yezoensis]|uniref:Uncharacterized protein n=1 Tax=Pyropia yezoensis TaxID=2788 RepID=A0ACC3BLZ7_PYRYE|nr:hypothetical protein I4F81_001108 [Neopyropia yezoensis]
MNRDRSSTVSLLMYSEAQRTLYKDSLRSPGKSALVSSTHCLPMSELRISADVAQEEENSLPARRSISMKTVRSAHSARMSSPTAAQLFLRLWRTSAVEAGTLESAAVSFSSQKTCNGEFLSSTFREPGTWKSSASW